MTNGDSLDAINHCHQRKMKRIQHMFSQMPPSVYSHRCSSSPGHSLYEQPVTCLQASRRNGWGAVGRSFQGIPVSPVCACIYSSRTPRETEAPSNWLQTILATESGTADDGRSETTPRARRDGGIERMCDTGSRWHSPQWDPELLTPLLTTTALKKSVPMATALSKTLWK